MKLTAHNEAGARKGSGIKRTGRCICGIELAYHHDAKNRFVSCEDVHAKRPRAKVVRRPLRVALLNAGARP